MVWPGLAWTGLDWAGLDWFGLTFASLVGVLNLQIALSDNAYYTLSSEDEMIQHVLTYGPVSVCLDASNWNTYVKGEMTGTRRDLMGWCQPGCWGELQGVGRGAGATVQAMTRGRVTVVSSDGFERRVS